jgi:hypothetical protein
MYLQTPVSTRPTLSLFGRQAPAQQSCATPVLPTLSRSELQRIVWEMLG